MPLNPFGKDIPLSMSELQDEMGRMLHRLWSAGARVNPFSENDWMPDLDVRTEAERFVVSVEVPGVDIGAIDVSYADGILTITGTRCEDETKPEGSKKLIAERRFGSFSRQVPIPAKINADDISASCAKGVLEVVLPKAQASTTKTIKVEAPE